ncbi:hypothetical protein EMIHUDRAFT_205358 [Emiliania huxleyi CCMP1516]|uniref:Calponin-homology (CH) domain-containing protein n=2 Tax=Emiliania huxleyi TaxID=2903 RepID=A0A0D3JS73_EMIH1|nr:hypothetical protein EMIHUDRAFT_205358 [Emiliania huxleyi CCMP1516]EOD26358.1 hypothetical protein EMIHUDRAFT_205358 [Emiliania huxleyi CCMP1516]|eukprot:XP_005778787.1 hypothetical protein EMIHUDRAFT_205358 [Emiliania huxleyi CCMP1516]
MASVPFWAETLDLDVLVGSDFSSGDAAARAACRLAGACGHTVLGGRALVCGNATGSCEGLVDVGASIGRGLAQPLAANPSPRAIIFTGDQDSTSTPFGAILRGIASGAGCGSGARATEIARVARDGASAALNCRALLQTLTCRTFPADSDKLPPSGTTQLWTVTETVGGPPQVSVRLPALRRSTPVSNALVVALYAPLPEDTYERKRQRATAEGRRKLLGRKCSCAGMSSTEVEGVLALINASARIASVRWYVLPGHSATPADDESKRAIAAAATLLGVRVPLLRDALASDLGDARALASDLGDGLLLLMLHWVVGHTNRYLRSISTSQVSPKAAAPVEPPASASRQEAEAEKRRTRRALFKAARRSQSEAAETASVTSESGDARGADGLLHALLEEVHAIEACESFNSCSSRISCSADGHQSVLAAAGLACGSPFLTVHCLNATATGEMERFESRSVDEMLAWRAESLLSSRPYEASLAWWVGRYGGVMRGEEFPSPQAAVAHHLLQSVEAGADQGEGMRSVNDSALALSVADLRAAEARLEQLKRAAGLALQRAAYEAAQQARAEAESRLAQKRASATMAPVVQARVRGIAARTWRRRETAAALLRTRLRALLARIRFVRLGRAVRLIQAASRCAAARWELVRAARLTYERRREVNERQLAALESQLRCCTSEEQERAIHKKLTMRAYELRQVQVLLLGDTASKVRKVGAPPRAAAEPVAGAAAALALEETLAALGDKRKVRGLDERTLSLALEALNQALADPSCSEAGRFALRKKQLAVAAVLKPAVQEREARERAKAGRASRRRSAVCLQSTATSPATSPRRLLTPQRAVALAPAVSQGEAGGNAAVTSRYYSPKVASRARNYIETGEWKFTSERRRLGPMSSERQATAPLLRPGLYITESIVARPRPVANSCEETRFLAPPHVIVGSLSDHSSPRLGVTALVASPSPHRRVRQAALSSGKSPWTRSPLPPAARSLPARTPVFVAALGK